MPTSALCGAMFDAECVLVSCAAAFDAPGCARSLELVCRLGPLSALNAMGPNFFLVSCQAVLSCSCAHPQNPIQLDAAHYALTAMRGSTKMATAPNCTKMAEAE